MKFLQFPLITVLFLTLSSYARAENPQENSPDITIPDIVKEMSCSSTILRPSLEFSEYEMDPWIADLERLNLPEYSSQVFLYSLAKNFEGKNYTTSTGYRFFVIWNIF